MMRNHGRDVTGGLSVSMSRCPLFLFLVESDVDTKKKDMYLMVEGVKITHRKSLKIYWMHPIL